jgi:hypothetical protein
LEGGKYQRFIGQIGEVELNLDFAKSSGLHGFPHGLAYREKTRPAFDHRLGLSYPKWSAG